ncbi:GalNAc(5)-diNAcBac-PP-undecaprenol beta-1,3-glucosyltransferase [Pigmentiphaga humi]|uniref:GalNAc(5)-diNAcBac-PP-undecaprenol beta-1,3-glucosyltransferase n=1 Tax=Pigmentiphaga humi TaxID=2478468 RepID=A0A3P4B100_9BURK|nr:glycosyltransferase family A protein [Pigmentiphaga humi]VCU69974.1 GalNAc(5)-diNAcBac-PP-undecaprenol beta-1,3-glucosyltransferase [Pigmentiphaga humi]
MNPVTLPSGRRWIADILPALDKEPRVSVVIPTYRRPDMLMRCLAAVAAQDMDPMEFEILVVDDGPDEGTRDAVERFAGAQRARGLPVRYLQAEGTQGPSGARNRGWENARAAVIAFTDDDTIPTPSWLARGLAAMADGAAAAVGGIRVPVPARPRDHERDTAGLERVEFATANCLVRKSALAAVGGFDERFTMAWREDSDLQFMLMARGLRIVRAPDAVVLHPVRPAPAGISVPMQRKVYFDALLYKKHPSLYRQRIRPRPPWNYFAIVAGVIAMAAGFAAGAPWLTWAGLVLWAALTLQFFLARLRGASLAPSHVVEMLVTSILIPPLSLFWRLRGAWHFRARFL